MRGKEKKKREGEGEREKRKERGRREKEKREGKKKREREKGKKKRERRRGKKNLSEVGFEPTPTYVDQKPPLIAEQDFTLESGALDHSATLTG